MLSGSITALITPFRDGLVDEDALHGGQARHVCRRLVGKARGGALPGCWMEATYS